MKSDRHELFETDEKGRTSLFHAAKRGDLEEVKSILFRLAGTGVFSQRLALIDHQDLDGLTAIEVAEQAGELAIRDLLQSEKLRMEYSE